MLDFNEYKKSGYSLIPKAEFERYAAKARLTACKYVGDFDGDNLSGDNLRGIFEVAELFYSDDKQINKPVLSFQNNGYSETYGIPSQVNIQTADERVWEIIRVYFTREQLYKGV